MSIECFGGVFISAGDENDQQKMYTPGSSDSNTKNRSVTKGDIEDFAGGCGSSMSKRM